jgi:hypothetical protein
VRKRLIASYILAVLALSSVDLTYEWYSPLVGPEGRADWYGEIGLRNGIFIVGNREPPGGGIVTGIHIPRVFPLPFYLVGGPEGGGLLVAVWFLGAIACISHHVLLSKRDRRQSRS